MATTQAGYYSPSLLGRPIDPYRTLRTLVTITVESYPKRQLRVGDTLAVTIGEDANTQHALEMRVIQVADKGARVLVDAVIPLWDGKFDENQRVCFVITSHEGRYTVPNGIFRYSAPGAMVRLSTVGDRIRVTAVEEST